MSLSVGIIGLPNVGKSTLFNILLDKSAAESANFPFTTIEPNVGVVPVPDERLPRLAKVIQSGSGQLPPVVPATVRFVDIAGLVAGAAQGEGLGNQFLAHVRETDVLVQVVRVFEAESVVKTGQDPSADINTINTELALKDLETLKKHQDKLRKKTDSTSRQRYQTGQRLIDKLSHQGGLFGRSLDQAEGQLAKELFLLTIKPMIYLFNLSETQLSQKELVTRLTQLVAPAPALFACLKTESQLMGLPAKDKQAYLDLLGQTSSAVDKLITTAYDKLNLISFLTAGVKEVRAWSIVRGTPALQAAGVIHSDFQAKFVKAKVVNWRDFVTYGGWSGVKSAGKLRLEGRDYLVQDGDVVEFMVSK